MATYTEEIEEGQKIDAEIGLYLINKNNEDCSFPKKFNFGGLEFVCLQDVFMPEDAGHDCFIDRIPVLSSGMNVLEIGSGTGVIICGFYLKHHKSISKILATDINPQAVRNTKLNFEKHNVPGTVILSDLFENVPQNEEFDVIFWNMPFFRVPENKQLSFLERAIADAGYKTVETFLTESSNHLSARGKCLLGFSPEMGDWEVLSEYADKHGKKLEVFWSGESDCPPLRKKIVYQLLEVKAI